MLSTLFGMSSAATNTHSALNAYYQHVAEVTFDADAPLSELLQEVGIRHFKKYSFSSLDFNLKNRTIPLHSERLIHQLIENKTGCCLHHNAVFQAILLQKGIKSWLVECIVHDALHPGTRFAMPTHVAIMFDYNDQRYLFDPGWDGTLYSIYSLPETSQGVVKRGQNQIRHTGQADYPFAFELIKSDDSASVRYEFNVRAANLDCFHAALEYLNSEAYAFHTLFLFTRVSGDNRLVSLINRDLVIKDPQSVELLRERLPDDVSVITTLEEHFGNIHVALPGFVMQDFKNPALIDTLHPVAASELISKVS